MSCSIEASPGGSRRRFAVVAAPARNPPPVSILAAIALAGPIIALTTRPASAVVLTVTPTVAVGISNNVTNQVTTQPKTSVFGALTAAAQLELTRATSLHRVGYTIRTIQYADGTAGNTSSSALWGSQFSLNAQLTLSVGADASIYAVSAIQTQNPATATFGAVPAVTGSGTLINSEVTQALTYQPSSAARYAQSVLVGYSDAWRSPGLVPRTLRIDEGLRGDRIFGPNAVSLNLLGEEFDRLDSGVTTATPVVVSGSTDQAVSLQALAGLRRDLSVTTTASLEAGPMVVFGFPGGAKWVPGLIANLGYRSMPWYWTLTASQQPLINPFLGQMLIADALSVRLSLPLNARESLMAVGSGAYTYARAVTPIHDLVLSDRQYDLIQAGASLAYQFERLPFFTSLDYLETRQSGSMAAGQAQATLSSHRRAVSVTFGGNFAWGEGNRGIPIRQPATHP